MKVMQLFLPPSLSNFWQDNTSIQLSSLIMFHACVPALIVVLSHFTPVWCDFVINNDRPKKAHPCWRSSRHPDASDGVKRLIFPTFYHPSELHIVPTLTAESNEKAVGFKWLWLTHTTPRQTSTARQMRAHITIVELWKGIGIKRQSNVCLYCQTREMEAQQGQCYC